MYSFVFFFSRTFYSVHSYCLLYDNSKSMLQRMKMTETDIVHDGFHRTQFTLRYRLLPCGSMSLLNNNQQFVEHQSQQTRQIFHLL